ncbi:MAG: glutathione peroxidase [Alphaproteobacteria bacterium]|nr:glutathione peroxidase [Alphaproteobacteria bacterium]
MPATATFRSIDSKNDISLEDLKGKVVLVVNTASACGYTPQYAALEKLWQRYRNRGLVVLGVPSNDFGAQEPGNEQEIQAFCTSRFAVSFPMTAKQTVVGGKAHAFYRWVTKEAGEAAAPRWNFHKILIGKDGALAGVFPSKVDPLSKELTDAIDAALA